MKKQEKEQQEKKTEFSKPIYRHLEKVLVKKIVLELTRDEQYVKRVRLETESGNITYKPKYTEKKQKELAGIETENTETKLFGTSEFIASNPMLVTLSKNTKKEYQEIICSYAETTTILDEDETEDKPQQTYKFMRSYLFNNIYYPVFHKEDKTTLENLEDLKDKYSYKEVDLGE